MRKYIEKLNEFLSEQHPNFPHDVDSLLGVLYYYYTEDNPIDNALIRCQFKELDDCLKSLSWEQHEMVFATICNLCSSFERQAFLNGIPVGVRLYQELSD